MHILHVNCGQIRQLDYVWTGPCSCRS